MDKKTEACLFWVPFQACCIPQQLLQEPDSPHWSTALGPTTAQWGVYRSSNGPPWLYSVNNLEPLLEFWLGFKVVCLQILRWSTVILFLENCFYQVIARSIKDRVFHMRILIQLIYLFFSGMCNLMLTSQLKF